MKRPHPVASALAPILTLSLLLSPAVAMAEDVAAPRDQPAASAPEPAPAEEAPISESPTVIEPAEDVIPTVEETPDAEEPVIDTSAQEQPVTEEIPQIETEPTDVNPISEPATESATVPIESVADSPSETPIAGLLPPNTAVSVDVIVTDPTGEPVSASASLMKPDGSAYRSTVTDADGQAHLMYVPHGEYAVHVRPSHYARPDLASEWWQDANTLATASLITVSETQLTLHVELDYLAGAELGQLRGTVTASNTGLGIPTASVTVYRPTDHLNEITRVSVDDDGRYDVRGLEPGEYDITFYATGYRTANYLPVTVDASGAVLNHSLDLADDAYPIFVGNVRDYANRLVPGARVEFWTAPDGDLVKTAYSDIGSWWMAFSDTIDHYPDLGEYYVRFVAPENSDVQTMWWPGVANPSSAEPYSFTEPGTHVLDIRLKHLPPVAQNDFYAVDEGVALVVPEPSGGLLANDTGKPPLTVAGSPGGPAHGTLTWYPDGTFTYIPDPGFVGVDILSYGIWDGDYTHSSNRGRVTIVVGDVPATPVAAADDQYTLELGETIEVDAAHGLLANDQGAPPLSFEDVEDADSVFWETIVKYDIDEDGSFTMTAITDQPGVYELRYVMQDGYLNDDSAAIILEIVDPNATESSDGDSRPSHVPSGDTGNHEQLASPRRDGLALTGSSTGAEITTAALILVGLGGLLTAIGLRVRRRRA
ncbi:5-hydroxyisourate hydrolase-like protein (transthyretin family) [Microbacteriaceae bacterium SG_E_30_P1]|uniref:alpha-amylase n=1 Tax=Antiquaquibacter oligotrophicus TaxID=2880260 RepID=A0ABT6KNN4_9MICO|nr:carboxypeptidase regulatory-like domain-containing protein [Antiquaquibacter oligotrophicus]MDH6181621.1 5-hydroxyisourate hydrolase-like protein (transthyretin family) [Antiquaquibacter oligotrophicus]UDF12694.1 carboxypeptidase regulatory-like domain-containing protein [Antiquaquibacter oligotrophicus]